MYRSGIWIDVKFVERTNLQLWYDSLNVLNVQTGGSTFIVCFKRVWDGKVEIHNPLPTHQSNDSENDELQDLYRHIQLALVRQPWLNMSHPKENTQL